MESAAASITFKDTLLEKIAGKSKEQLAIYSREKTAKTLRVCSHLALDT